MHKLQPVYQSTFMEILIYSPGCDRSAAKGRTLQRRFNQCLLISTRTGVTCSAR